MEDETKKAKIFLWSLKSPLQTFKKIVEVISFSNIDTLYSMSSDYSLDLIIMVNNLLKYSRENWYMGSIKAKFAITKNKIDPLLETGR